MNYELLYNKLREGEHLTDLELQHLFDHASASADMLGKLGSTFRLARNELLWIAERATSILTARKSA